MHSNPKKSFNTRVVACRGAVQLASAIAAMRTVSEATTGAVRWKNHLVIHNLSAPEGQAEEFAQCIQGLAERAEEWESIHYISLPEIRELQQRVRAPQGLNFAVEVLGIAGCDELYTGQDDQFLTTLLRTNLSDARHVCFGDGIGLNFTNAYFCPKENPCVANRRPFLKRLCRRLKSNFKGMLTKATTQAAQAPPREFDIHCLLLKNLFDQQLSDVLPIDGKVYIELFHQFGTDFPKKSPEVHTQLSALQTRSGKNAILLTSNFAETGRMSLEGEIDGYLQLLRRMPMGDDVTLIIKPHPRDSYEKIRKLEQEASRYYGQIVALMDPWNFYLPFESLYARYFANTARPTSVAAASSATISLEYLYGQRCHLGFGQEIVAKSFVPLWQPLRHLHEQDLTAIVHDIRSTRPHFSLKPRAA